MLALALAAALTAPHVWGDEVSAGTYGTTKQWTTGNLTIDSGALISDNTSWAVLAAAGSGVTLGTLTNNGALLGSGGFFAATGQSVQQIVNNSGGVISGTSYDIKNQGHIGTLINSGNIGTFGSGLPSYAILNESGGTIDYLNNNGGTIFSLLSAIQNNAGATITALNNSGSIISRGTNGVAHTLSANGISNSGLIGTITNSGVISASTQGTTVVAYGLFNGGSIGTVSNQGLIQSNNYILGAGVYNAAGGLITLVNNGTLGTIEGKLDGISNSGSIATIINAGTVSSTSGATGAAAVFNTGTISTLTNSGLLTAHLHGIDNRAYLGTIINSSGGTIYGGTYGVYNTVGASISLLGNAGTINGGNGIENDGSIGTISNTGLISGSYAVFNGASAVTNTLSNSSSGTIYGSSIGVVNTNSIGTLSNAGLLQGAHIGIYNIYSSTSQRADIGTLSNSGSIVGSTIGIYNFGSTIGTLSNTSSGIISGNAYAIKSESAYTTLLSNAGTITSSGIAIANVLNNAIPGTGTLGTLSNSGLIYGGNIGVSSNTGTLGTILNSGTISGGQYAISIGSGASLGGLANSGIITGKIQDLDTNALTISGGSGSKFGTLTGSGGVIGSIVAASGLVFSSGNQLLNDNVSVNSGSGTVTLAGGVLQVNNQITIDGNYYQDAASTLAIGIGSTAGTLGVSTDTGYGRLIVSGDATIESGASVVLKKLTTYNYAVGQRFVVVQAAGNADYNASNLTYTGTGYSASGSAVSETINSVVYSDLVVTITGVRNGSVATNGNANAALNGLFNYGGVNQGLLDVFNPAMAITDPGEANKAGAQLSPAATAGAAVGATSAANSAVQGAVSSRLDNVRVAQGGSSGIATGEYSLDPAAWGRIFGGQANQGERDGISGYHANYGGLILGGDVQARPDWRVGGLFSLTHVNVGNDGDNSGSGGSANSYGLMAYAGYDGHPWYLNLSAGVARQLYSTTRDISYTGFSGIANGSFRGTLFSTSAQAGYPLAFGDATLTPLAGMRYSAMKQDGYTETGGSGAALTVNGSSYGSLKSEVGAKYERSLLTSYGEVKPFVQLSWNHEYRDTALTTSASFAADTSGSTAFTTQGASALRNTAALQLGATLLQSKNLTLMARYTLEGAKGYTAQTGDLTLRWQY